jgi:hypothetical protein
MRMILMSGLAALGLFGLASASQAQVTFYEDFDTFLPAGWVQQNNSVSPQTPWTQATTIAAPPGLSATYANANFGSTGVTTATGGNISNWLITPTLTLTDGQFISFWTVSAGQFADNLQVRWSTTGSDVGSTFTDVGDFTTLLLDINPTLSATGYPTAWTNVSIPVSGIGVGVSGRLAFRYFVPDGGINGNNSNGIGIDGVAVASAPEPGSLALGLLALPGALLLRRKKRA